MLSLIPQMVLDINQSPTNSFPRELVEFNGLLFFNGSDGIHGQELWRSDGTPEGTFMLKDIDPGPSGSNPDEFINIGGTLYFAAYHNLNGEELWKTDGTVAGTVLVKNIRPDNASSRPRFMINVDGVLYFSANDGVHGEELWKSDGTEAGTVLVKDIRTGSGSSIPLYNVVVNGMLFFAADDGVNGLELWRSDGTEAGTFLVKDIFPGSENSLRYPSSQSNQDMSNVGGMLIFSATDEVSGREIWKSDGTEAGTQRLKDINPGSNGSKPQEFVYIDGTLFFSADDGNNGRQLWKTDGTEQGTVMITALGSGSNSLNPRNLVEVNGALFFVASFGGTGDTLWKSDGTASGTLLVSDFPGTFKASLKPYANVDGALFFVSIIGPPTEISLWRTDGTTEGTLRIDFSAPDAVGGIDELTAVNSQLFFVANDELHGHELWTLRDDSQDPEQISAGGPYVIREGESPTLDASRSHIHGSVDTDFEWDIDGDGIFGDLTGKVVTLTWSDLIARGIADGPQQFEVAAKVELESGPEFLSSYVAVDVLNMPPSVDILTPTVPSFVETTLVLTAFDPSEVDRAAGFVYEIDWNDNGSVDTTLNGGAILHVAHTFVTEGSHVIRVRAIDKDGDITPLERFTIQVVPMTLDGDLIWHGSVGNDIANFVQIDATTVEIQVTRLAGQLVNLVSQHTVTGRVVAYGLAGNDRMDASQLSTIPVHFEGGFDNDTLIGGGADDVIKGDYNGAHGDGAEGNDWIEGRGGNDTLYGDGALQGDGSEGGADTILGGDGDDLIWGDSGDGAEGRGDSLLGGAGNDVILGHTGHNFIDGGEDDDLLVGGRDGSEGNDTIVSGNGNDILVGNKGTDRLVATGGRNLLLGGRGQDTLLAGSGGDILVADTTTYDQSPGQLATLRDEWASANDYALRVSNIRFGGGLNGLSVLEPDVTVFDDQAVDHLIGGSEMDLFLYSLVDDLLEGDIESETKLLTAS